MDSDLDLRSSIYTALSTKQQDYLVSRSVILYISTHIHTALLNMNATKERVHRNPSEEVELLVDLRLSKARTGRRGDFSPSAESGLMNDDTGLDEAVDVDVVDIIDPDEVGLEYADISDP